jgi:cephalosporin-C deacetylase
MSPICLQVFCLHAELRNDNPRPDDVGGVKGNTHQGHIIRGLDDSSEKLIFPSIFLDCAQLAGIVMNLPEVDANRVGATGGSQGGALTLACAALETNIKRVAPVFLFLCDYKRVWDMDLASGAYAELATFFKQFDLWDVNTN